MDIRHNFNGQQRLAIQHDARLAQLPDPAELGECVGRFLRQVPLSQLERVRPNKIAAHHNATKAKATGEGLPVAFAFCKEKYIYYFVGVPSAPSSSALNSS